MNPFKEARNHFRLHITAVILKERSYLNFA